MQPIHLHHENIHKQSHIYFLLIPSLVFFLVMTIFMFIQKKEAKQMASSNRTFVLGEESIDNENKNLKN